MRCAVLLALAAAIAVAAAAPRAGPNARGPVKFNTTARDDYVNAPDAHYSWTQLKVRLG